MSLDTFNKAELNLAQPQSPRPYSVSEPSQNGLGSHSSQLAQLTKPVVLSRCLQIQFEHQLCPRLAFAEVSVTCSPPQVSKLSLAGDKCRQLGHIVCFVPYVHWRLALSNSLWPMRPEVLSLNVLDLV